MTIAPGPAAGQTGRRRGWGELLPRTGSAAVMAALALVTAWLGGLVFEIFWWAAAVVVLREWLALAGISRGSATLLPGAVAIGAAAMLAGAALPGWALVALVAGAGISAVLCEPASRVYAASGVFYAGTIGAAAPLLRQSEPFGLAAILWLFAVVWGTDTMAFFGGRLIGGPKLAPRLSPSKTWSGFLVGILSGALLGVLVAPSSDRAGCVFAAGLFGGALAQGGDLFESSLKRRFGAKDAGSLIPGHGGLMDRLDGFVATSLFAAVLGAWRFGPAAAGAGLFKW